MYNSIIQLDNVSKMYRMFRSPRHRIMDTIGFPFRGKNYDEFWAFRDISIQINAGERVGLVGRNGAGKSTLLKLIAGIIQPSSGQIEVRGKVQALMELGTGFHPELTGRKNVLSSFAYQGVVGKEANRLLEEVLDFSELEDFIDKPVKIYSSGMYARLAFAASTAIRPDILIIDEILGAGDAYFAGKSAKRMKDLTAEGTTVLFVSHDIAAVQMICDRALWLERGQIIADDHPIEIGRQYAASIRKQEELRLRAINLKISRGDARELLNDSDTELALIMRFVSASGDYPISPIRFYEIALKHKGNLIDNVLVGGALDDDRSQRIHLLTSNKNTNWGEPKKDENNRTYREFCDCQGKYGHAPANIKIPLGLGALEEFSIEITHDGAAAAGEVLCEIFTGKDYRTIGTIDNTVADCENSIIQNFSLDNVINEIAVNTNITKVPSSDFVYGDRNAWIEKIDFLNELRESQRVFVFGETLVIQIDWKAKQNFDSMAFVITFYGMDGRCVTQVISDFVSTTINGCFGTIEAHFKPLMVGSGDYFISIGIFDEKTETNTIDKPLYVENRQHRIKIIPPHDSRMERGIVIHPIAWQCSPQSCKSQSY